MENNEQPVIPVPDELIEEMKKNGSRLRKAVQIALSFSKKIRSRFK